jgi:ribokinase
MAEAQYHYLIVGGLREDYCITHDGRVTEGAQGGNAAYAGAGAALWNRSVGLLSRVGCNYPTQWLEQLQRVGFDVSGVIVLPEPQDTRTFYAYLSPVDRVDTNPAFHFQRIGRPLPKALLDYRTSTEGQQWTDRLAALAVRPEDLPAGLAGVQGAHLAPADFLTHSLIPIHLRRAGVSVVTLDPSSRYMEPNFHRELPGLVRGLDAFLPSQAEARSFFEPRPPTLWEMAEGLAAMGCRFVVLKSGGEGQFAYDAGAGRRWHIPAYPARVQDVTGAGDAFCGGFLVGLVETGDLVEACLRGSVSASLAIEGVGALYALGATSRLAQARLEALRDNVRQA